MVSTTGRDALPQVPPLTMPIHFGDSYAPGPIFAVLLVSMDIGFGEKPNVVLDFGDFISCSGNVDAPYVPGPGKGDAGNSFLSVLVAPNKDLDFG